MLTLREEHRIVGTLVGCLPRFPRQVQQAGLPLLLMPEEVSLLLKEKVAIPVMKGDHINVTNDFFRLISCVTFRFMIRHCFVIQTERLWSCPGNIRRRTIKAKSK